MEDSTRTFLKLVHILKDGIQMRQEKWQELRQHLSVRVRTAFIEFINKRGFEGRLLFDHDQLSLSILVQTTGLRETQAYSTQAQFKAPINLSGGERSYSTISFLLALWNVAPTTISCLDEWDVFLDSANRSVAANMLVSEYLAFRAHVTRLKVPSRVMASSLSSSLPWIWAASTLAATTTVSSSSPTRSVVNRLSRSMLWLFGANSSRVV